MQANIKNQHAVVKVSLKRSQLLLAAVLERSKDLEMRSGNDDRASPSRPCLEIETIGADLPHQWESHSATVHRLTGIGKFVPRKVMLLTS